MCTHEQMNDDQSGSIKETALGLVDLLAVTEAVATSPELDALHKGLRRALYRHGLAVGLSREDIAEIDNHLVQARGGTPKTPEPEGGG